MFFGGGGFLNSTFQWEQGQKKSGVNSAFTVHHIFGGVTGENGGGGGGGMGENWRKMGENGSKITLKRCC